MRNITIRARIILLISIAVIFALLVGGAFYYEMLQVKGYAVGQTQEAMFDGQKEKLKVSTHAMALSLGESLKDNPTPAEKVDNLRRALKDIRLRRTAPATSSCTRAR